MEEQLVDPLRRDLHRPLLLLQVLRRRLPSFCRLHHKVLDLLRVQGVENLVEEVPVREPFVALFALGLREIMSQLLKGVDDLRVDDLDAELGPARDVSCRHVFLLQGLLAP